MIFLTPPDLRARKLEFSDFQYLHVPKITQISWRADHDIFLSIMILVREMAYKKRWFAGKKDFYLSINSL